MKIFILFSLISLVFLLSCKKNISLPYTFTGKVSDVNGNPIANATLKLSAYYQGGILSGGGYGRIATTKTDNTGNFKAAFNFDSSANNLMIQVFADNYFPLFNENIFTSSVQSNTLIQNITLYELSTIKISFKNTSPVSSTDNFYVFQTNEIFGPSFYTLIERQFTGGTFNELEQKYIGNNIQGYEVTKTKGDTYTLINWTSKKNGIIKYEIDSIFIAGGAQGNFNINY
jgi:hypothetical protein